MTNNIALVPLDSRPVSVGLPLSLAGLCGLSAAMPPARLLGDLHAPADIPAIRKYLLSSGLKGADTLFVAADLLCYGGLIFSREHRISESEALKNLDFIRKIKSKYPDLKIHAFGVILRDSISVRSNEDFKLWKKLASGRSPYPEDFLKLRARNHRVNHALIDLAAEGIIDYAAMGKEDTAPNNPFNNEVISLKKHVKKLHIGDHAGIINGTDELPLLLLARDFCKRNHWSPRFRIETPGGGAFLDKTLLFESRPLDETIKQQIRMVGGRVSTGACDVRLLVHGPRGKQKDLFAVQLERGDVMELPRLYSDTYYSRFVDSVILDGAEPVAVADVAYANGADPRLIRELLAGRQFLTLAAYASWNTASNTLGTVTAAATVITCLRKTGTIDNQTIGRHVQFMMDRIADDWLYQSHVRGRLAKITDNPHSVENPVSLGKELMRELGKDLSCVNEDFFLFRTLEHCLPPGNKALIFTRIGLSRATLPWRRLFEAGVSVETSYSILDITGGE